MARKPFFFLYYLKSIFELWAGVDSFPQIVRKFTHHDSRAKIDTIRLKNGLSFQVRGKMDIWSVKEAMLDRYYERCGFQIQRDWTVVDIGAGIGEFTIFAAQSAARIVAYEPFPQSYELLKNNVALNQLSNIEIHPVAIASKSGSMILDTSLGEPLKIQSRTDADMGEKNHMLQVSAITLVESFANQKITQCDLLKLDCEGAEYDILFGAEKLIFDRITRIVMEYHDGVTSHSHKDLQKYLENLGYRVDVFDNPVHTDIGYLRAERV